MNLGQKTRKMYEFSDPIRKDYTSKIDQVSRIYFQNLRIRKFLQNMCTLVLRPKYYSCIPSLIQSLKVKITGK